MTRVLLRFYLSPDRPLGPGKIRILESIRDGGSISGAAREMGMSYRSAWLLVDSMNSQFKQPVVSTTTGGPGGGSAKVTEFGKSLIRRYRAMERSAQRAIEKDLATLERDLRQPRNRKALHAP